MADDERQRVERIPGARRARLTRVKGTLNDSDAEATLHGDDDEDPAVGTPDDERLKREKPPHY